MLAESPGYAHADLRDLVKELAETGEFVASQCLGEPKEGKVARGEKNGLPVTDGILPEWKEFLLGYWIVNVASPERAYAIAGRISAATGPGGSPTDMPIEVRQFADSAPHGYDGLIDRRRGKPSERRVPLTVVEQVLGLYREKYFGTTIGQKLLDALRD